MDSAVGRLSADAQKILDWLRQQHGEGRPRVYSPLEIARGAFGRTEWPGAIFDPATSTKEGHSLYATAAAPQMMFDPALWPKVVESLALLEERGLVEQAWLPQGDRGYRLNVGEIYRAAERARA